MILSSVQNPRVKAAARLRERSGRDEQGRIIIDGGREIGGALAAEVEVIEVYYFPELCRDEAHQGLLRAAEKMRADLVDCAGRHIQGAAAEAGKQPLIPMKGQRR